MSSLSAIRDAIKSTLTTNITGLVTYDTIPDAPQVPCVIVAPREGDFEMNGNCVMWEFDLYVLTARGDFRVGQDKLDSLVDGAGSSSIRAVIKNNQTLGLSDCSAHVTGVNDYGGEYRAGQVQHYGAKLALKVMVTQ